MRSLFLKIFLWFWAAMALVVVVFAALVARTQERAHNQFQERRQRDGEREQFTRRLPETTADALTVYLETAATLLERSGPDALQAYRARLEKTGRVRTFLFEGGRELPRPAAANAVANATPVDSRVDDVAPQDLKALVHRAAQSGSVAPEMSGPLLLAARRVQGGGQTYVIVGAMRGWPFGSRGERLGRRDGPRGGRFGPRGGPPGDGRRPPLPGSTFRWWAWWLFADPQTQTLRLLALLATTGIVCYGLVRHLTSPILQLRGAVHRLADGDLSARVGAKLKRRQDELGVLGRDFDLMAERLESLRDAQNRLIADISHELRSPLTRLSVALGLVRDTAGPEAAEDLDRIESEAMRLNFMIGQLLTISRLESGEPLAANAPVNMAHLLEEIVADADFEARSRRCAVRVEATCACQVAGTESLLHSAIENVVRNAVRYTGDGTTVEISLDCEQGAQEQGAPDKQWAVIRVRDHGAGAPEESLAHLFRPFYRIADARDRQSGGTGLGLAITERAVRLHGGQVGASNAPGGGLLVEIRLPCANAEV